MSWLDALLAFSVLMMLLSTIVSAIVESIHSFSNQRVKGLERLVEHMYDKVITPRLGNNLPAGANTSRFVKQMTDMRWLPLDENAGKWQKLHFKLLKKTRRVDKVQQLTTLEFLERLAETSIGNAILERSSKVNVGQEKLGVFLEDLASKFEDCGDSASKYFAQRARMISILVGFVLVFTINFNVVDVVKTLAQSEESRQALIKQGDEIAERLTIQLQEEAQAMAKQDQRDPEQIIERVSTSMERGMETLKKTQLPIGWKHSPWYEELERMKGSQWAIDDWFAWISSNFFTFLGWFFSVFLAGVLVGLGGPFWFDTYKKLSVISSVAKSFQSQVKHEEQAQVNSGQQDAVPRAKRFVDIFNTSREANNFAKVTGRRALSNDGTPLKQGYIR